MISSEREGAQETECKDRQTGRHTGKEKQGVLKAHVSYRRGYSAGGATLNPSFFVYKSSILCQNDYRFGKQIEKEFMKRKCTDESHDIWECS